MPSPENSASGDKRPQGRPSNNTNPVSEELLDAVILRLESAVRTIAKDFPDLAVENSVSGIQNRLQEFKESATLIIEAALKDPSWSSQERVDFIERVELVCASELETRAIKATNKSDTDPLTRQVSKFLNESRSELKKQFNRLVDEAASTGAIMDLVLQEADPNNILSFISATALRIVKGRGSCAAIFVCPVDINKVLQPHDPEQVKELGRGVAWSRESRLPPSVTQYLKHVGTYHNREIRGAVFADKPEDYPYEMKPDCIAYVANKRLTLIPAYYGETLVGAVMLLTDKGFRFSNDSKARLHLLAYESAQAMAHIARINYE